MEDKIKLIGVEAFKLQQMQKAKIKIPSFVVLSADLFDLFFTPLKGPLFELKSRDDLSNSEKSFQAQKLFWAQETHETVKKEIFRILKVTFSPNKLLKDIWAIRPSWVGVGRTGATEAPQTLQGAFLGVKGEEKILEAIKGLWSLVLEETIFLHEDFSKLKVAVIVQEFIHAEVSGLLWTGNPIQRRPHEMLIQGHYGLGLGEELNSSNEMVSCDSWRTDQKGVVQSEVLAVKQHFLEWNRAKGHGVITNDVPDLLKNRPILNAKALNELAQIGKKIENVFGMCSQKISWSYSERHFWILSSETIKAFAHVKKSYPLHIWQSEGVPSGIRGIVAPLSFSLFRVFWQGLNLADLCYRQGQVFIKKVDKDGEVVNLSSTEDVGKKSKLSSLIVKKNRLQKMGKFIFSLFEWGPRQLALHQGRRLLKEIEKGQEGQGIQEIQEIDLQIFLKVHAHFKKGEVWQRLRDSKDFYTELMKRKLTRVNVSAELKQDILSGVMKSGRYDFLHLGLWICGDEELYHFIKNASEDEVLESLMRSRVREEWDIFRARFLSYLNIWGGYGPFEFKLEVDSYTEDARPILSELKELLKRSAHEIQSEIEELEGRRKSLLLLLSHQLEVKKVRFPVIIKKGVVLLWWLQNKEHEWQHQTVRLFATLRRSFRKLGGLWVSKELLEKDDDVFYLTIDEIMQTLQETRYTENYFDLTMMRRLEALNAEALLKKSLEEKIKNEDEIKIEIEIEAETSANVESALVTKMELGAGKNSRFYSYGPYDAFWVQ